MTEEEAMECWCPFARVQQWSVDTEPTVTAAANRDDEGSGLLQALCLGSGCMAWRWDSKTTGYCGLAGRPAA
jgi:hypothetical protein